MNRWIVSVLSCVVLSGCTVGYNATLFAAKSNAGIDIDSKPPTAEVSIARREGVLEPSFEGGRTLPVVSTFSLAANPFRNFFFGVGSVFAGGDAALFVAEETGTVSDRLDSRLCLSDEPSGKIPIFPDPKLHKSSDIVPLVFGTDTSFGLKLAWSGLTAQFPDTARVGFNRKDLAIAPVFLSTASTDQQTCRFAVEMPSFLATVENGVEASSPAETKVHYFQSFATGEAAVILAKQDRIKRAMQIRFDPVAFSGTYDQSDASVTCIEAWLKADDAEGSRLASLNQWWSNKSLSGFASLRIVTEEHASERKLFIQEKGIECDDAGESEELSDVSADDEIENEAPAEEPQDNAGSGGSHG